MLGACSRKQGASPNSLTEATKVNSPISEFVPQCSRHLELSSSVLDSNTPPPPPVKDVAQAPAAALAKVPHKKGPLMALEATVLEPTQEGPVAMLEHSATPEEPKAAQLNSPDLTTNLLDVQRGAQSHFMDSQDADSDKILIDGHTVIMISWMRWIKWYVVLISTISLNLQL